jgi:hypothetical protein
MTSLPKLPLPTDIARQQLLYASGQMQFPSHLAGLHPIEKQYVVFYSEETKDWVHYFNQHNVCGFKVLILNI